MAAKKKSTPTTAKTPQQTRLWLMYPPKLITKPLIWQIGQKFKVVTNIRQASVTDEIGIVCPHPGPLPKERENVSPTLGDL